MPEARELKQKLVILNDLWPRVEQLDVVAKPTERHKCIKIYYKHQYVEYICLYYIFIHFYAFVDFSNHI